MAEEIQLRNLTPDDLPAVAEAHLAAFPHSALTRLGREAVRRYYEWQLLGPHEAVALGAFQNERLAGFCFGGYFRGALSGFLKQHQAYLAWRVATHPWLIASPLFRDRLTTGWQVWKRKPAPVQPAPPAASRPFGILAIAVHPARQQGGVGRLLMLEAEEAARRFGTREMRLTVDTDNQNAIRFYEGLGWRKSPPDAAWSGTMLKTLED